MMRYWLREVVPLVVVLGLAYAAAWGLQWGAAALFVACGATEVTR